MFLLRFLILVFILAFVFAIGLLVFFFRSIRNVKRQFDGFTRQRTGEGRGAASQTVSDRRTPGKAAQKIIPRDEGEYVDFEES